MRSLRKLNAAAGTSYTRWEQVVAALKHETAKSVQLACRRGAGVAGNDGVRSKHDNLRRTQGRAPSPLTGR